MQKVYFVSDLHMFSNRSQAGLYLDAIPASASGATTFVLGGDIFDFRWAAMPTVKQAVDEAIRWLSELAEQRPGCHFHFLLGNHDYLQAFIERLTGLAVEVENLSWHRFHLRLGSNLFLHGDVADRRMTAEMLADARAPWLYDRKRGRVLSRLYELGVMTRLHTPVAHVVYPRRIVARRILAYLEDIGQGPDQGVRNVYFGHTHLALSDYLYGGLTFHNGGAPIKGSNFHILEVMPSAEKASVP